MLKKALSQKPQQPIEKRQTPVQEAASEATEPLNQEEIRLAVCVPCREMIHAVFSHNLHSMLNYNWQKGIDTKVFYNMGTLLQNQRESLVSAARSWAATHILWLDSDMSFPFYTAYKLLDHAVPVVSGNYATRQVPYKTVAYKELGGEWDQYLRHNKDTPLTKELVEVEGIGMGCMLTKIDVYDKLEHPYFPVTWSKESEDYLGEDINFCMALRKAGYTITVDDILSRQLNHIGAFAFGHDLVQS
jgi:hypothetical protein